MSKVGLPCGSHMWNRVRTFFASFLASSMKQPDGLSGTRGRLGRFRLARRSVPGAVFREVSPTMQPEPLTNRGRRSTDRLSADQVERREEGGRGMILVVSYVVRGPPSIGRHYSSWESCRSVEERWAARSDGPRNASCGRSGAPGTCVLRTYLVRKIERGRAFRKRLCPISGQLSQLSPCCVPRSIAPIEPTGTTTAPQPSFLPLSTTHVRAHPPAAIAAVPPLPAPRATAAAAAAPEPEPAPPATPSPAAAKCPRKRKAPAAKAAATVAAESPSEPQPVGKRGALFDLAREDQEARLVVRPCVVEAWLRLSWGAT